MKKRPPPKRTGSNFYVPIVFYIAIFIITVLYLIVYQSVLPLTENFLKEELPFISVALGS